jgi:hypothetical protein
MLLQQQQQQQQQQLREASSSSFCNQNLYCCLNCKKKINIKNSFILPFCNRECRISHYFINTTFLLQIKPKIISDINDIDISSIFSLFNDSSKSLEDIKEKLLTYETILNIYKEYINIYIDNEKKLKDMDLVNALTLQLEYIDYIYDETQLNNSISVLS